MAVRTVAIAAISALVLFAVWKKRVEIEALLTPTPPPPAIQFDNGSATPKTSSLPQQPQFAPGAMRKCINGTKVSYIDSPCPPGSQEKAVAGPPVTVLEKESPPAPKKTGG
jgi:hypothetical protein